jgi:hypothetical protein
MSSACDKDAAAPTASPSASAKPKTPDRLLPGELAEGDGDLFGLRLPKEMRLEARFPTSAHATGLVEANKLVDYVKRRILVRHVELAGSRTVFDKARIKGTHQKQLFRIEIIPKGRRSKLAIELLNPAKPPAEKGLSEAERWRRVGLTPDGKQLNPKQLE